MTLFGLSLALRWGVPEAQAFCGAYVGSSSTNHASVVVVVRQGDTTTLTLANDFGDATGSFAYVVPVPPGLSATDVTVVDPAVIARLDAYSAPRTVAYSCDDVVWSWSEGEDGEGHWEGSAASSGCGGETGTPVFVPDTASGDAGASNGGLDGSGDVLGVRVSDRTTVGSYTLAVVQARGAEGLEAWLATEGFAASETTTERLQVYIDAGQSFLVARVDLDTLPEGRSWLEPLRISYPSDGVSLPLWLGAASSSGDQDLLIFGVTDMEAGALAIANFDNLALDDECLTDDADTTMETQWQASLGASARAPWVSEFGWLSGKCDPCANDQVLTDADLGAIGFEGPAEESFFTRIHMRYRPDQIDADVALYESGVTDRWQLRYIDHTSAMEEFFDVCDGTAGSSSGSVCEAPPEPDTGDAGATSDGSSTGTTGGLCSGVAVVMIGAALRTRRRR